MAFKLLNGVTSQGASPAIILGPGVGPKDHSIQGEIIPTGMTPVLAVTLKLQVSNTGFDKETGVVCNPGLRVAASDDTKLAFAAAAQDGLQALTTQFDYLINEVPCSVQFDPAGQAFSAAHVVSANKYGAINVYVNAAGAITTDVPLATQAYNTASAAVSAAIKVLSEGPWCPVGRVIIQAGGTAWTANTSDMVAGSDLAGIQVVSFGSSFRDVLIHQATNAEIADGQFFEGIKGTFAGYGRLYLSSLTGGSCIFNGVYNPADDM